MKKNWWKIAVVIVVVIAVVGIAQMKTNQAGGESDVSTSPEAVAGLPADPAPPVAPEATVNPVPLPPAGTPSAPGSPTVSPPPSCPASQPAPPAAPRYSEPQPAPPKPVTAEPAPPVAPEPAPARPQTLPRMLELGSVNCIPCKMMVPVMEALKQEYPGRLNVDFVDVMANPAAGEKYQIQSIPTQILFDASGREVFRHIGFWPKEEIVAKFKELGLLD